MRRRRQGKWDEVEGLGPSPEKKTFSQGDKFRYILPQLLQAENMDTLDSH